jgi:hypothetical protein
MSDASTAIDRCATCGADLPADGAPCAACAASDEARTIEETLEATTCEAAEPECAPGSVWVRIAVACVYLIVGAACAYGSLAFFDADFTTSSDWVFGAMAIALALIALLGIKESLFPSDWKPD